MKSANTIQCFTTVLLRTPLISYNTITQYIQNETSLKKAYNNPVVQEALYLASSNLHQKMLLWLDSEMMDAKEQKKLVCSLMKYLLRMSYRPTPFGMFAGISTLSLATSKDQSGITLSEQSEYKKHTQLDRHFVEAWAKQLEKLPEISRHLKYFPNNSLYRLGGQLRHVAYNYENKHRKYHIAAIDYNEFTALFLRHARSGITIEKLLQAPNVLPEESVQAKKLIEELIAAQILVSELEPVVTGEGMEKRLLETLENIPRPEATSQAIILRNVLKLIERINASTPGSSVDLYHNVIDEINKTAVTYDSGKLFQTDMSKPLAGSSIEKRYADKIIRAITFLRKLYRPASKTNPDAFREAFIKRYEDEEIPLLTALDTETGIGYPPGKHGGAVVPLVKDLNFASNHGNQSIEWNEVSDLLLKKYLEAVGKKQYSVNITDKDMETLVKDKPEPLPLPATFSAMASIVYEDDKEFIQLHSAGGASATQLTGRFCHADENIHRLCAEIAQEEQQQHPDAILAEIIHVPESRLGNILQRPVLRRYEIPYLGQASVEPEQQITADDLMVSVDAGKIKLRSKKLNKEIIPRLSSAHNFSFNSLPVYHFLCDLQTQSVEPGIGFGWGPLNHLYPFLPRVVYRDVILSPATWHFEKSDFQDIIKAKESELLTIVKQWAKDHQMPRYVALADGDNELVIDLQNLLSLKMLHGELKKRNNVTFTEAFIHPDKSFVTSREGLFTHQLIFSFATTTNTTGHNHLQMQQTVPAKAVKRTFIPGEEWVYYKIYCGQKTADALLTQMVKPAVDQLYSQEIIDQWFFIRYADPDFHLRVRFKLKEGRQIDDVASKVKFLAKPFIQQGFIDKIQLDTYKREIERYGAAIMSHAEQLFCNDSAAVLELQALHDKDETCYWQSALLSIDYLLNDFGYNLVEKKEIITGVRNGFAQEFQMDNDFNKPARLQLDKKYRKYTALIRETLSGNSDNKEILMMHDIYSKRSAKNHLVIKELKQNIKDNEMQDKIGSLMHMSMNRIFASKSRLQELVIYDFLNRHYTSAIKRKAAKQKSKPLKQEA